MEKSNIRCTQYCACWRTSTDAEITTGTTMTWFRWYLTWISELGWVELTSVDIDGLVQVTAILHLPIDMVYVCWPVAAHRVGWRASSSSRQLGGANVSDPTCPVDSVLRPSSIAYEYFNSALIIHMLVWKQMFMGCPPTPRSAQALGHRENKDKRSSHLATPGGRCAKQDWSRGQFEHIAWCCKNIPI